MELGLIFNRVKEWFTPDTQQVSEVKNVDSKKQTVTIPMVSEKSEQSGDKIQINQNSRNRIYQKLEALCVEYRMSIEDVKKYNLLENIAGVEDITTLSEEEITQVLIALNDALGITGHWKAFWKNRDINDINEIAKDANQRLINLKTGGSWLGQVVHNLFTKDSLKEEVKFRAGDDYAEKVKQYFKENYLQGIENLPEAKKREAYNEALIKFGYFLQNSTSLDKEALSEVLEILKADDRLLASELLIKSCGIDKKAKATVAFGIESNREDIVTKTDAFNERPDEIASTKIASLTFGNMDEIGIQASLEAMSHRTGEVNSEIQTLLAKKQNGTLTSTEAQRLSELEVIKNNYSISGYAGASLGISTNSNLTVAQQEALIQNAFEQAETHKIAQAVYNRVTSFAEANPQSNSKVIETINKATNNKFITNSNQTEIAQDSKKEVINPRKDIADNTNKKLENKTTVSQKISNTPAQSNKTDVTKATTSYVTNTITTQKSNIFTKELKGHNTVNAKANVDTLEVIKTKGLDGLKEVVEAKGPTKAIIDIFNNLKDIPNEAIIINATAIYETLDSSRQANILRCINNDGLSKLLAITSDEVLKMLENETFANYWATEQVENAVEEVKEKDLKFSKNNLFV